MTSVTMVGFAAAILWLRWRVAGGRGLHVAALMAALLSMNMAWLFGFTSFMLGACLFPITLGRLVAGRDRLSLPRLAMHLPRLPDARVLLSPRESGADDRCGLVVLVGGCASAWTIESATAAAAYRGWCVRAPSFVPVFHSRHMLLADRRRSGPHASAVGKPGRPVVAAGVGGAGSNGLIRYRWRSETGCRLTDRDGPAFVVLRAGDLARHCLMLWWYGTIVRDGSEASRTVLTGRCGVCPGGDPDCSGV